MLLFFPGDDLPKPYCGCLRFMFLLRAFCFQFQRVKYMLSWSPVKESTCPLHNFFTSLPKKKKSRVFSSLLQVMVRLHHVRERITLFYTTEFILLLLSATTLLVLLIFHTLPFLLFQYELFCFSFVHRTLLGKRSRCVFGYNLQSVLPGFEP